MNKLEVIKQSIQKTTGRTGLVLKKYSPEILMGAGHIRYCRKYSISM